MNQDIRWKQRFQNFDRAYACLQQSFERGTTALSMLERDSAIGIFDVSFDMARITLKDYLEQGGVIASPIKPRQVLEHAFAARILADVQVWFDMLNLRNLPSQTYDASVKAVEAIDASYLPAMGELHNFFLASTAT
jgi:nucleotidyltransferase substrate binding protein (TIGR01987 family)